MQLSRLTESDCYSQSLADRSYVVGLSSFAKPVDGAQNVFPCPGYREVGRQLALVLRRAWQGSQS